MLQLSFSSPALAQSCRCTRGDCVLLPVPPVLSCLVLSCLEHAAPTPREGRVVLAGAAPRPPLSRQLHGREAAAELGELLEGDGEVLGEQLLVLGVDLVRVRGRGRGRS